MSLSTFPDRLSRDWKIDETVLPRDSRLMRRVALILHLRLNVIPPMSHGDARIHLRAHSLGAPHPDRRL